MLATALEQYRRQQRITALGLIQARRVAPRGSTLVARTLMAYQSAAIMLALEAAPDMLAEQGIDGRAVAQVVPSSLLTGTGAADLFDAADSSSAFDRLVRTLIVDGARTATQLSGVTRPAVTGHVRALNPPSCSRCAVLAGRVYRYSDGFQRHPACDCLMVPTNESAGRQLVTSAADMFARGQITDLTKADRAALEAGADIGQVVNVRRKAAGLTNGSSVLARAGRPTPAGILQLSTDRVEQLALLRRFGYIT